MRPEVPRSARRRRTTSLSLLLSETGQLLQAKVREGLRSERMTTVVEPGMGPVLFALFEADTEGLRLSELADGLGSPRSTMTSVVRRLEERRLVSVAPDPLDGRARLVKLTPRARAARAGLFRIRSRLDRELRRVLSPRVVAALVDALSTLLDGWSVKVDLPTRRRPRR